MPAVGKQSPQKVGNSGTEPPEVEQFLLSNKQFKLQFLCFSPVVTTTTPLPLHCLLPQDSPECGTGFQSVFQVFLKY